VAICLSIAYYYLAYNLDNLFAENLKEVARSTKIVFLIFTASFITRAVVYVLMILYGKHA